MSMKISKLFRLLLKSLIIFFTLAKFTGMMKQNYNTQGKIFTMVTYYEFDTVCYNY
jgi:hypothetical protein